MLHQAVHWSDVSSTTLWPMAVQHAVFLYNHMPNPATGLSPNDLLTKTRWPQSQLADVHVWGCPVYVLDKTIQDGKKLPRWKPRSTRQIYVGMSPKHASSVPLCLNPETGAITPQFHVVFDDTFSTIATSIEDLPDFSSDEWAKLFGDSTYQYILDDDDVDDDPTQVLNGTTDDAPPPLIEKVRLRTEATRPPVPLPVAPPATQPPKGELLSAPPQRESPLQRESPPQRELPKVENPAPVPLPTSQRENVPAASVPPQQPTKAPPLSPPSQPSKPSPAPKASKPTRKSPRKKQPTLKPAPLPTRTSSRSTQGKAPSRWGYDATGHSGYFAAFHACINTDWNLTDSDLLLRSAYKVRATKDPDILNYTEAMRSDQRDKWCESAKIEIEALEGKLTWKEVPISEATSKIIPGTWVFRVKRNPSGEIKKYKARYCVRGDLEDTPPDEDNFAPTVAFSSVRLFLVLCLILGWTTASVDYSSAFVQSKLETPKWIHLPRGFVSERGPGTCLRLEKSLYGLSVAPALWSKTVIAGLKKCGFKQSEFDPCFLYKKGMMLVLHVDDAGIGAADPADIDKLIDQLRALGFELKKEGNFEEFLGIKLEKQPDGSIELTQTGLIDKTLEAAGMSDCNPNRVPATGPLGTDPNGAPMNEEWNYRSIVGMLQYLASNTRPDIAFAVSQVARFSANPKQSHASAVKTILRYLKRTRTMGSIVRINGDLNLDLFVDADFCGLYKVEEPTDPNSVRSRTGYVIKLSGVPATYLEVPTPNFHHLLHSGIRVQRALPSSPFSDPLEASPH